MKFYNGEVNISAVKIGTVVRDPDPCVFGHITGFTTYDGIIALLIKWQNQAQVCTELPMYVEILL